VLSAIWLIQGTKSQEANEPEGEKARGQKSHGAKKPEGKTANGRKSHNSGKPFHILKTCKY